MSSASTVTAPPDHKRTTNTTSTVKTISEQVRVGQQDRNEGEHEPAEKQLRAGLAEERRHEGVHSTCANHTAATAMKVSMKNMTTTTNVIDTGMQGTASNSMTRMSNTTANHTEQHQ